MTPPPRSNVDLEVDQTLTPQKKDYTKENERTNEFKSVQPETEKNVRSFVRSFSKDEEKIHELLKPLGLDDGHIESFLKFPLEEIKKAIELLKRSQKKIINPAGFLNAAIREGWKKSKTRQDISAEVIEKKQEDERRQELNRAKANQILQNVKSLFTKDFTFEVSERCLFMKKGVSWQILDLKDENCIIYLNFYIEENT